LYVYGLPDVCSLSLSSTRDFRRLSRAMESALATFEPRLRSIRVALVPVSDKTSRVLRFQIEGVLRLEPVPEHVTFDTTLELTSGEYDVRGEPGAG
jgi:type VI secretion system protein ImpF